MEELRSPYPEKDIRTLWWDIALSMGENPEKFIQDSIKEQNKKFDAKQHWRDTFRTEPPNDFPTDLAKP